MKALEFPALNRLGLALVLAALVHPAQTAWSATDPTLQASLVRTGPNIIVSWAGASAVSYQLESSSNLTAWVNAGPALTGNGSLLSVTNSGAGQNRGFFRIHRIFAAAPGSAVFNPSTKVLTIVGDALHTVINVANDGTGVITINSGDFPITGGVATVTNTVLIQILGSSGDDQIGVGNGLAPAHIFGAEGNDTLSGGSFSDLIVGGPGNDTISGRQGNDMLYPDGGDIVVWNPGDGSDLVAGQGGNNTLVFNGSNANENIALSANGSHLLLTRDVAAIAMDVNGVQTVNVQVLGGTDNVTVNSLAGTSVTQVNIDLAASGGGGDGLADTVFVGGTAGPDIFNIAANGNAVEVSGLGTLVHVTGAELANDRIAVNSVGGDTVNVNGTAGADTMQILPSTVVGYVRTIVSGFAAPVDVIGALTLQVNGLGGPDTISGTGNLAGLAIPMVLDGGDGDDIITGGNGGDTIYGGAGNDTVTGAQGNDTIYLGSGTNTVVWNPGDGSDSIEGQSGSNTLVFNGSNANENIALSANGSHLLLTRDVAAIAMDVNGVQTVNVQTLGGADTVTVNSLAGTSVTQVNVDLAASGGAGDAQVDTVLIGGSAGADTFNIAANGSAVEVTGVGALVHVTGAELANDRVAVNGGGGDTVNVNGTAGADTMQILPSSVAGSARVIASGFTAPVDVIGALTLQVNGLGGPDTISGTGNLAALAIPLVLDGGAGDDIITGGNGNDTIYGGADNDTVTGAQGSDTIYLGSGTDTVIWNPGDGSDTIEGQSGNNTLVFNGSNASEVMALSANGSRLQLTRNVGAIVMDVNGVQTVNVQALGGVDNLTVNSLAGTSVTQVNIDLGATGGVGDGSADTVTLNGTTVADKIDLTASVGSVIAAGLTPTVQISHPETIDTLIVNGLGGTDIFTVGPGVTALIGVILNQ